MALKYLNVDDYVSKIKILAWYVDILYKINIYHIYD